MDSRFLLKFAVTLLTFYLFINWFFIFQSNIFLLIGSFAVFVIIVNHFFGLFKSNKVFLFDIHGVYLKGDSQLEDLREEQGTRKIIEKLKKKHKVSALTNMSPELFKFYNNKWELNKKFDNVFYSGRFGLRKPHPQFFRKTLDKLGKKSHEVIFIDDTQENVLAAKRLGIKAIRFSNPKQLNNELHRMGLA